MAGGITKANGTYYLVYHCLGNADYSSGVSTARCVLGLCMHALYETSSNPHQNVISRLLCTSTGHPHHSVDQDISDRLLAVAATRSVRGR